VILGSARLRAQPQGAFHVAPDAAALFDRYCYDCHDDSTTKGDVRLDNLASLPLEARLDLLNRVQEKVFFGEMPPKKKSQPSEAERNLLAAWVSSELRAHNASKLEDKLRMPEYGNVVDHDKLFSGKYKDLPGFTPDRRWLINEFIFDAKMNVMLEHKAQRDIDGKRQQVIGDNNRWAVNLTNPFLLPTHSGVRYYDTAALDGGHLLTMISNAKELSAFMVARTKRTKTFAPSIDAIMAPEWAHEKILKDRESYLTASIEQLLLEIYRDKNDALLPVFVPLKREPLKDAVGKGGKVLKKANFDTAAHSMSREEVAEIYSAMKKNFVTGEKDDALILKCEKDWFRFGVNERAIEARVKFMRGYMGKLHEKLPNVNVSRPPRAPAEPEMAIIRAAILKHRKTGDRYNTIIEKCMTGWTEEFKREREKTSTSDDAIGRLVDELFNKIIERAPTTQEKAEYTALTKSYFPKLGNENAIEKLIQTLILRTDFVYRQEFGEGKADEHGRKMLSPRDASYALAYALTDSSPDKELAAAAGSGKLNTREDYRREVERMLKNRSQYYVIEATVEKAGHDSFTNIPIRKLRFFREFFGYPRLLPIFKDNKRFGGNYVHVAGRLVSEADMLVEFILNQDQRVFERLLTTEEYFVYHTGDNAAMAASTERIRKFYEYFKDKDWQKFDAEKLKTHIPFLKENPMPGLQLDAIGKDGGRSKQLKIFLEMMTDYTQRLGNRATSTAPFSSVFAVPSPAKTRTGKNLGGAEVAKFFNLDMASWNYPTTQPAKMEHRKGILTHPAWLIAFAGNTATDPVRRGKWVREKLLAGTVPDVPVTVDAVVPEDPHNTLRTRLAKVSEVEYCWKCHERMNPLGYSFEMYDDFGRYRTEESLEYPENLIKKMPDKGSKLADKRDIYKTLPVDAKGKLVGTGDPSLDGDINGAMDLAERLGKSTKVRQSIIRHAFRYFMGRNEVLSDSKTLIDADQAYVQSGGSFDAVIVSLLTSDSFIYRKPVTN
jgi:hypothetical protein